VIDLTCNTESLEKNVKYCREKGITLPTFAIQISKKRYIVEQYFGLSHLHDGAYRARFTTILKNIWDTMCRQMVFNVFRGSKLLANA